MARARAFRKSDCLSRSRSGHGYGDLIGLILATPLTVCVVVLSKYVPQLDFISVLMSDEPVMKSDISFYQRLLAGDQDEAAGIVEEHLKTHQVEKIYDEVLVPALNYVKRDRRLGRLAENDQQLIFQATREILEDLDELKPESSSGSAPCSEATIIDRNSPFTAPKVLIVGCPVRDEANELALLMFRQFLDPTRYELALLAHEALSSEVIEQIAAKNPAASLYRLVTARWTGPDTLHLQTAAQAVPESKNHRRPLGKPK